MKEYLEKSCTKYVVATFDNPTNYVMVRGLGCYSFIDNIVHASKYTNRDAANETCNELSNRYNIDLVVVPVRIDYVLLEED